MSAERRTNVKDRDRIADLEASWHAAVKRLDRRYRRVAIAVTIALLIALAAGVAEFLLFRAEQREEEAEIARAKSAELVSRGRANFAACLSRNETAKSIKRFLIRDLQVSVRTEAAARSRFPVEPDCRSYVRLILGDGVPRAAFDLPAALDPRDDNRGE
jgi:hypothetical protein